MSSYIFVVIGAVLVNNVVFVRILGLCPFMGVSKKLETAIGMGAATTFVLTVASGTSYLIDHYLLQPNDLAYLRTLSFIVVIAAIVQLTELVIQKTSPLLHQVLGIYLPLITTNCAVLGVPLLNVGLDHNLLESLLFGFGSSVGFTLALISRRTGQRHYVAHVNYSGSTSMLQAGTDRVDAVLLPGVYDLVYSRGHDDGSDTYWSYVSRQQAPSELPNGYAILREGVVIGAGSQTLDVDVIYQAGVVPPGSENHVFTLAIVSPPAPGNASDQLNVTVSNP